MTNLTTKLNVTKPVTFIEPPILDGNGLNIKAKVGKRNVEVNCPPAEAALILLENHLIDDCYVGHCSVVIRWGLKMDLDHLQNNSCTYVEMCWEDFVKMYELTDFDACNIITRKLIREWFEAMKTSAAA